MILLRLAWFLSFFVRFRPTTLPSSPPFATSGFNINLPALRSLDGSQLITSNHELPPKPGLSHVTARNLVFPTGPTLALGLKFLFSSQTTVTFSTLALEDKSACPEFFFSSSQWGHRNGFVVRSDTAFGAGCRLPRMVGLLPGHGDGVGMHAALNGLAAAFPDECSTNAWPSFPPSRSKNLDQTGRLRTQWILQEGSR